MESDPRLFASPLDTSVVYHPDPAWLVKAKTVATSSTNRNPNGGQPTLLSLVFFGETNINEIQALVRHKVWVDTGKVVSNLSKKDLLLVMSNWFGNLRPQPWEANQSEEVLAATIRRTIQDLNDGVVATCVQSIESNMTLLVSMNHGIVASDLANPKATNIKGTASFRDGPLM